MTYDLAWLKHEFDKGETIKYIFFREHTSNDNQDVGNFVFNQWFLSPFAVDGISYKTAGHWMMAHKASLFGDTVSFNKIIQADKVEQVKELGRQIEGFHEAKWNEKKYEIVKAGNIHKFHQNKTLKEFLLGTDDSVIVEASPTDTIWGIGLGDDTHGVNNPYAWRGLNLLGFALMDVRDLLRQP